MQIVTEVSFQGLAALVRCEVFYEFIVWLSLIGCKHIVA